MPPGECIDDLAARKPTAHPPKERDKQPAAPGSPTQVRTMRSGFGCAIDAVTSSWRQQVCFARNQEILCSTALKGRVGLITSGLALRQRRVRRTEWQAIDVYLPGDVVGLEAAVLGQSATELTALSSMVIAVTDVAAFKRLLGSAVFFETLLSITITQHQRLENRIVRLGRLSAEQRVAAFLVDMHKRLSGLTDNEVGVLNLALTQRHLANLTGLTPIHVNRVLKKFRCSDIMSFRGGVAVIKDFEALHAIACADGLISAASLGL